MRAALTDRQLLMMESGEKTAATEEETQGTVKLKEENTMKVTNSVSRTSMEQLNDVTEPNKDDCNPESICDQSVSASREDIPESASQLKEIDDACATMDTSASEQCKSSGTGCEIESPVQSIPRNNSVTEEDVPDAVDTINGDDDKCERSESVREEEDDIAGPGEALHTYMLGKICRICAEMTVVFDGPKKGVPKMEMVRYVNKIWKVDLSDEDSNQYPVNVCLHCERKIKRLYLKVSKKKKCEMFRTEPAPFEPHKDQDCPICSLKDADVEAQSRKAKEDRTELSVEDATAKASAEPRRNPARKRGWPDHEPPYKSVGCQTNWETLLDATSGLEEHDYSQDEGLGQYLVLPKKLSGRTPYHKQPLYSLNAKYIRQDRLKPLISHIDKYCITHKENKVEVMFFLLMQALRDAGDRSRENAIVDIWTRRGSVGTSLTEEECLAKRILLKQTKEQYRKEYSYYKEKLDNPVLKPPFLIDKLEKTYFPEHLDYYITDGESGPVIHQHEKRSDPSYFALQESVDSNKVDGVMGVRWRYFDAVAKTLEELVFNTMDSILHELNENSCIYVDLSDYCEEKKDMTYLADKSDGCGENKRQQGKIITYVFCVQSLQVVVDETVKWMPSQDISSCSRPLMKALVTEGSALRSSLQMIEEERNKMAGKCFHITSQDGSPLRFVVFFSNEAPEVRRDYRNITGLSLPSFKKAPTVISRYGNLCLELKRSWLASSPQLSHIGRVTNSRIKCGRCGELGHNVRKCSKPSLDNAEGVNVAQPKRQKKHRAVPVDAYAAPSSNVTHVPVETQPHLIQQPQQSMQQLKPEQQESLSRLTTVAADVDQSNSVVRSEDQLLWTCPVMDSASQANSHSSQVLIPSSNSEFQPVPHRTVLQGSQGASPPVYVWTYAVVQPQSGSVVQQQQQQQQPISHQHHHLTAIHQQQQQQLQQQPSQQQQQQQQPMTVIHQQPSQQQQLQPLSVIHHQQPRQQTLSVGHRHEPGSGPPQDVQQLGIIHQPSNGLQGVETSQQQLTMAHQTTNAQQQAHQISLVHQQQQQVSQAGNIVHHTETSSPHEQLPHNQNSDLQPIIGQW
ncbi:uncharacterized protein [Palaemon carinicauda]|uniref:uncharacterized protein n=1 Tax=Palaemon carinicauda TaxID=392227 RepID=UPI0035B6898D